MAVIKDSNLFGPLSPAELDMFERDNNINLPRDYRSFLLEHNGGRPTPSFFWIDAGVDGSGVNQFFGLHQGPYPLSIHTYVGKERYGVPESMMPIGDDGTGNMICIGITAENMGKILFIQHEIHPFQTPNSLEGVVELANSFSEFMESLQESPQE